MRKWEYSQFSRGHLFQQHPTPHTYPCTPLTFCGAPVYTMHLPGGDCFRNPVTEKWITVYIRLNLPFPKGKAFILEKNSSGELHRCLQVLWNASIFHAKLVSDLGTFSGVGGVGVGGWGGQSQKRFLSRDTSFFRLLLIVVAEACEVMHTWLITQLTMCFYKCNHCIFKDANSGLLANPALWSSTELNYLKNCWTDWELLQTFLVPSD